MYHTYASAWIPVRTLLVVRSLPASPTSYAWTNARNITTCWRAVLSRQPAQFLAFGHGNGPSATIFLLEQCTGNETVLPHTWPDCSPLHMTCLSTPQRLHHALPLFDAPVSCVRKPRTQVNDAPPAVGKSTSLWTCTRRAISCI